MKNIFWVFALVFVLSPFVAHGGTVVDWTGDREFNTCYNFNRESRNDIIVMIHVGQSDTTVRAKLYEDDTCATQLGSDIARIESPSPGTIYFQSTMTFTVPAGYSFLVEEDGLVVDSSWWEYYFSGGSVINISDSDMTTEWTCNAEATSTVCVATAGTETRAYDGPTYYEWLLIAGLIIFLLSFAFWPRASILKFKTA